MIGRWGSHVIFGSALLSLVNACAVGPDEAREETQSSIVNGTPTTDTVGNAFLQSSGCSGTMLTPQWVLAAGHCIEQNNPAQAFTNVAVFLGNSTTGSQNATEFHIHPNWWHPGLLATAPPSPTAWNAAFDVSLLHLPAAFSAQGYTNRLYNQISNRSASAGQTVRCFGYGGTSLTGGGGLGHLQTALLPIGRIAMIDNGQPTNMPMIELNPNSSQQILFFGDSGGGCSLQAPSSEPNVIGINRSIVSTPNQPPTEGWAVQTSAVHDWIDQTMHSSAQSLGLPPAGTPTWTSAVSTPAMNGSNPTNAIYVIAGYPASGFLPTSRLYMKAFNTQTGWSAWSALGMAGLPSLRVNSRVALAATTESPGTVRLELVVLGSDQKMYIAPFTPGFVPGSAWTSLSWSVIGAGVFKAGTQPSIVYNDPRVQVFGIGTDAKIWTNFKNDFPTNTWISDWNQVPTPMTFATSVSVARSQGTYYVVGLSDDTALNPNTGNTPWILSLTGATGNNNGTWSTPTMLWGNFLSPPSITSWIGGLAMYGLGTDSNIWRLSHNLGDPITTWGGWFNLQKGTFKQPEGVSANASFESATEIDIVTADSTSTPMLIRYPQ